MEDAHTNKTDAYLDGGPTRKMPTSRKQKRNSFKTLKLLTLNDASGSPTEEAGRKLAGDLGVGWPAKKV
ncbi:hypothetical protein INS49_002068 [Diaporthe citri]|uniref:uncharacterized protein n=1 Tax=Diaporthe citri TaxID=83186 RepID=UPI001C80CF90|nr:uncharacterized protein INS49_002068 [Diaporthe citri]KAG6367872.1 hypothetical protein INS49_002068 [Diaporthe citri]